MEFIKEHEKTWNYIDENLLKPVKDVVLVKTYISESDFKKALQTLNKRLSKFKENSVQNLGSLEVVTKLIDDEDWINIWKKHYKPIKIKNVIICPEWIEYQKTTGEKVILIDPGTAFGTGEHETTAMCIELAQDFDFENKIVFDIGCGSGILGITAVKLGAKNIFMWDIDLSCVQVSKQNAELNGIKNAEIFCGDLLDSANRQTDIIFANIVADVLIDLAKNILSYIKIGGIIIISGIINNKLEEVKSVYEKLGLKLISSLNRGDWNALAFKR